MSRTDRVVDRITQMILDGELSRGDRLPIEKDLAADLAVSRGSLREGVRALTLLGVLHTRQGDGTYVTSLEPNLLLGPMGLLVELQGAANALDIHTVRRLMETEAAGLAARNAGTLRGLESTKSALTQARGALDDAAEFLSLPQVDHAQLLEADVGFHEAIAALAGNPVLSALIAAFATRTARARLWRAIAEDGAEQRTQREHELILNAVAGQDSELARIRMATHLLHVEDFIDSTRAESPADGAHVRDAQ